MPLFFADVISDSLIEMNDHVVSPLPGMNAETVAQPLFERKFLRPKKGPAGLPHGFNPGGNKRADVLAKMVISKEKPFAVDIGKMIGVYETLLAFLLARFTIRELQLAAGGSGFG